MPPPVEDRETGEITQPPTVSATVTYTPSFGDDREDAFTFAATDPSGATGMATVKINPPGDVTEPPPPLDTVKAFDTSAETAAGIAVDVILTGGAPGGVSLTFSIDTPPAFGTLGDNHNDPPGSSPIFAAAAIDASGGPGSNGTVRFHAEWNISQLASLNLDSAQVFLNTNRGSVDSLDTFFFVLTFDQDGLLSDSDYQQPATQLQGVVMPVPDVAVGTDGTFSFDVTSELLEAVRQGRGFFGIQGRVNEALTGGGFQRGLQMRTTASGNLASFLEPQLALATVVGTPVPITVSVVALPENGTLTNSFGAAITSVPTSLPDARITYTPNFGFTGFDSFLFKANDGIRVGAGLIAIDVLPLPFPPCEEVGREPGCAPNQ